MSTVLQENRNIVWHKPTVTRERRERKNGHKGAILWFTGLSGSGKSTLAHAVEERLYQLGVRTFVLDGDNIRHGLCKDLGFSNENRNENIRRIGEVAKLFVESGMIVLTAFISPFKSERKEARELVEINDYFEIYCNCNLTVCEERDIKGLYKKARKGEIKEFTGITSPYEAPENPELTLDTANKTIEDCVVAIIQLLSENKITPLSY